MTAFLLDVRGLYGSVLLVEKLQNISPAPPFAHCACSIHCISQLPPPHTHVSRSAPRHGPHWIPSGTGSSSMLQQPGNGGGTQAVQTQVKANECHGSEATHRSQMAWRGCHRPVATWVLLSNQAIPLQAHGQKSRPRAGQSRLLRQAASQRRQLGRQGGALGPGGRAPWRLPPFS